MKKIKILELDITVLKETFTTYSAGIWQRTMSVPELVQNASPIVTIFGGTWDDQGFDPIQIGSVRVANDILGSVDSIEELREQDGSFYFDFPSQVLYLALFDYDPAWYYRSYKTGETSGFISQAQMQLINDRLYPVDSYIGASYYEPRLDGDLSIDESVDDQKNGIFIFDDVNASILNGDGEFDNIRDNVTGNEARVLIAHIADSPEEEIATGFPYKIRADRSDFNVVREGIVEDVDYSNPNRPVIKAIDRRSDWSQTIGENLLNTTDFPDLEDNLIDKRRPIIIGTVQGTKCVRVEPKPTSAANTDFLVCDTTIGDIDLVDGIYFDGKISGTDVDRFLTSGEYSLNTSTGILTVNNYSSGNAYFYGTAAGMNNPVEIILFLLQEYAGLSYIPSNYNLNEIEQVRSLGYHTHVYIDEKGEQLFKTIEKLILDIQIDFFQQGSVLTMRKGNEERASTEDIPVEQITDNPAGWVNDRTDTVKTISVGYNRDYRLDSFETYYDATKEQEAIDGNLKAIDKVFETNLTDAGDVQTIYDEYYSRFTAPSRTVTINRTWPFKAGLTDFVTFKVARQGLDGEKKVFERALYKIVQLNQNNNTAEIVYFSDRPEPYYSPGLAAFRRPAFAAPTVVPVFIPYSGSPAFRYAAFRRAASPGGAYALFDPVSGSGYRAGIYQQIGE